MAATTDGLEVGSVAYGSFGQYGEIDVKAGKVTKVTPSGQVTIDFQEQWPGNGKPRLRRFTNYGGEIGADWRGGRLIDGPLFARLAEKQKAEEAKRAVVDLLRSWSFKNKAELNALVARLNELADLVPDDDSTTSVEQGAPSMTLSPNQCSGSLK